MNFRRVRHVCRALIWHHPEKRLSLAVRYGCQTVLLHCYTYWLRPHKACHPSRRCESKTRERDCANCGPRAPLGDGNPTAVLAPHPDHCVSQAGGAVGPKATSTRQQNFTRVVHSAYSPHRRGSCGCQRRPTPPRPAAPVPFDGLWRTPIWCSHAN